MERLRTGCSALRCCSRLWPPHRRSWPRSSRRPSSRPNPRRIRPGRSLPQQEQLPAAPLVIAAYAVAWVRVFGYLWTIWRRLGRVERELTESGGEWTRARR